MISECGISLSLKKMFNTNISSVENDLYLNSVLVAICLFNCYFLHVLRHVVTLWEHLPKELEIRDETVNV